MGEVICQECGRQVFLRSQFETQCPECGSEELDEVDAYEPEHLDLVCVDCRYRVLGGGREGADHADSTSGRYSVEDPCPRCGGVLDPDGRQRRTPGRDAECEVARAAALKLIRKHGAVRAPVDVDGIARAEGLEVVAVNDLDHDGRLVNDRIEVPAHLSHAAARFAIAHELGHHCLRHQVPEASIEAEANAFAAELLISPSELKAAAVRRPTLRELCESFGVSREAMVYALMRNRLMESVAPIARR